MTIWRLFKKYNYSSIFVLIMFERFQYVIIYRRCCDIFIWKQSLKTIVIVYLYIKNIQFLRWREQFRRIVTIVYFFLKNKYQNAKKKSSIEISCSTYKSNEKRKFSSFLIRTKISWIENYDWKYQCNNFRNYSTLTKISWIDVVFEKYSKHDVFMWNYIKNWTNTIVIQREKYIDFQFWIDMKINYWIHWRIDTKRFANQITE